MRIIIEDFWKKDYDEESENYLNEYDIEYTMAKENVNIIRKELYNDFLITLCLTIQDTYLGYEYINTTEDIEGHFKWCFNYTRKLYKEEENIVFNYNKELYDNIFNYFLDLMYIREFDEYQAKFDIIHFNKIFNLNTKGSSRKEVEEFLNYYRLFEESFLGEFVYTDKQIV